MVDSSVVELKPIGLIHSPYKVKGQAPPQGRGSNPVFEIEIFKEYEEGLKDIEGFSHLIVIYCFHKSKGYSLLTKTPWDITLHGVFATRSPHRPNPIGFSTVKLLEREGNILKVTELDALDGTPVIDIKPFIPKIDQRDNVKAGWIEGKLKREK